MHIRSRVAGAIDHTQLKAEAGAAAIDRLAAEAVECHFAAVCVNPIHVARAVAALRGSAVAVATVAGFPLGASTPTAKAAEAAEAVRAGALEVDVVVHLPHVLACDVSAATEELAAVVGAVRRENGDASVKVILETAALAADVAGDLAERRIAAGCRAARDAGAAFVKTSTGFHPAGGATVEAVRLLKRYADGMRVKASGGIRTAADAVAMLDAGADRLGCSASVVIVAGLDAD